MGSTHCRYWSWPVDDRGRPLISILFELIELTIKLMIVAVVVMVRLTFWLLRAFIILIAAVSAAIADARRERQRRAA